MGNYKRSRKNIETNCRQCFGVWKIFLNLRKIKMRQISRPSWMGKKLLFVLVRFIVWDVTFSHFLTSFQENVSQLVFKRNTTVQTLHNPKRFTTTTIRLYGIARILIAYEKHNRCAHTWVVHCIENFYPEVINSHVITQYFISCIKFLEDKLFVKIDLQSSANGVSNCRFEWAWQWIFTSKLFDKRTFRR